MDKLESMLDKLPHFYDIDDTSNIYKILKAFADELQVMQDQYINRIDSTLDIYTTSNEDLEWKWGNLLGIKRGENESYEVYRNRVALATNMLRGGTSDSLKYAIAVFLRLIEYPEDIDDHIHIYDGWECTDSEVSPDMKQPGHVVCIFSFSDRNKDIAYYDGIEDDILAYLGYVKAAGITLHIIIKYTKYEQLEEYTYGELESYTYSEIGRWGI